MRDPDEAGRRRFAYYAPRIRCALDPPWNPGPRILKALKSPLLSKPLIPNLRKMSIMATACASRSLDFLHEGVKDIDIQEVESPYQSPDQPEIIQFYNKLPRSIPGVQRLILRAITGLNATRTRALAEALLPLTRLEHLELFNTKGLPAVVRTLSSHTSLRKVVLSSDAFYEELKALPNFQWKYELDAPIFPSTESLSMSLPIGGGVASMLADIRKSHSLQHLTLLDGSDSDEYQTTRDIRAVCEEIGRHETLRLLHLRYLSHEVTMEYIGPILQCRQLENLAIDTNLNVFLIDEDIRALATALPLLQKLKFNNSEPYHYGQEATTLTSYSILYLLAACPVLSSIELLVRTDRRATPTTSKVARAAIPARETLVLSIGLSPIDFDDFARVAGFIRSLGVRQTIQIEAWSESTIQNHNMDTDFPARWEEIQCMLE